MKKVEPYKLPLSPEAKEAYDAYFVLNEEEKRDGGFQENMLAWAGKFDGSMMKMAGLLHLSDYYDHERPWEIPISVDVMHRAAQLRDYYKHHAKAAYGVMKGDPRIDDAKYLLGRILDMKGAEFSQRDLFEKVKGKFGVVKKMKPILQLLAEHNYIREIKTFGKKPGRPSQKYEVNPAALEKLSHNSHKSSSAIIANENGGGDSNA